MSKNLLRAFVLLAATATFWLSLLALYMHYVAYRSWAWALPSVGTSVLWWLGARAYAKVLAAEKAVKAA